MGTLEIEELFSASCVRGRIGELAERVARDFADSRFVILRIDEGARRFVEALCAELKARGARPEVRAVRVRRTRGTTLAEVQVESFDPEALDGRDVLVVDDIIDEGRTLGALRDLLEATEPRSVRTAVLVDKREARREPVPLDYVGFRVEGGWVVGFGMDLEGAYRELDFIGVARDRRF
ncbi:MAG: phosphoribosyltransferase family protein [Myxococcota bacterium]